MRKINYPCEQRLWVYSHPHQYLYNAVHLLIHKTYMVRLLLNRSLGFLNLRYFSVCVDVNVCVSAAWFTMCPRDDWFVSVLMWRGGLNLGTRWPHCETLPTYSWLQEGRDFTNCLHPVTVAHCSSEVEHTCKGRLKGWVWFCTPMTMRLKPPEDALQASSQK